VHRSLDRDHHRAGGCFQANCCPARPAADDDEEPTTRAAARGRAAGPPSQVLSALKWRPSLPLHSMHSIDAAFETDVFAFLRLSIVVVLGI